MKDLKTIIFTIMLVLLGSSCVETSEIETTVKIIEGYTESHTPSLLNRVCLVTLKKEKNPSDTLILYISGWRAGTAWFKNAAEYLVRHGVDVSLFNRRQTLLENREAFLTDMKQMIVDKNEVFPKDRKVLDYCNTKDISFMKYWGLKTQLADMYNAVKYLSLTYPNIYLCGWSGGSTYVLRFLFEHSLPCIKGVILLDGCAGISSYSKETLMKELTTKHKEIERGNVCVTATPDVFYLEALSFLAKTDPGEDASIFSETFGYAQKIKSMELLKKMFYQNNNGHEDFYSIFYFRKDKYAEVKIKHLLESEDKHCHIWEWFYPQAVALDYYEFGLKCKEKKVTIAPVYRNIPVLNLKCEGRSGNAKEYMQKMEGYLVRVGFQPDLIQSLYLKSFYHADLFVSEIARSRVFAPILEFARKREE